MKICSRFESMETLQGAYLVHTNCADIKICFVTDEIVRVRASFDKELAEESYILSTTAWEDRLDGFLGDERTRKDAVVPAVTEDDATITFSICQSNDLDKNFEEGWNTLKCTVAELNKALHTPIMFTPASTMKRYICLKLQPNAAITDGAIRVSAEYKGY